MSLVAESNPSSLRQILDSQHCTAAIKQNRKLFSLYEKCHTCRSILTVLRSFPPCDSCGNSSSFTVGYCYRISASSSFAKKRGMYFHVGTPQKMMINPNVHKILCEGFVARDECRFAGNGLGIHRNNKTEMLRKPLK